MLGQRSPQRGFFDADHLYLDRVGPQSFYGFLAQHRGELFRDADFAAFYAAQRGRPSVPPSLLATALLLQTHDGVSDEEARDRAAFDLRWKAALGVAVEEQPFAKSTLQEFRAQLVLPEEQRKLFQASVELAKQRGWFRGRKLQVAVDTTNILGRGAVKDTDNLLADGIVQVLRARCALAGETLEAAAARLGRERYVAQQSLQGQAEVAWEDPAAQRRCAGGGAGGAGAVCGGQPPGPGPGGGGGAAEPAAAARCGAAGGWAGAAGGGGAGPGGVGARPGDAARAQEQGQAVQSLVG